MSELRETEQRLTIRETNVLTSCSSPRRRAKADCASMTLRCEAIVGLNLRVMNMYFASGYISFSMTKAGLIYPVNFTNTCLGFYIGGSNVPGEQASSFRFSFRPYLLFPLELNADQRSQQLSIVLHRDVLPHIEAMEVHE